MDNCSSTSAHLKLPVGRRDAQRLLAKLQPQPLQQPGLQGRPPRARRRPPFLWLRVWLRVWLRGLRGEDANGHRPLQRDALRVPVKGAKHAQKRNQHLRAMCTDDASTT